MKLNSNQKQLIKIIASAVFFFVGILYKTDNEIVSLVIFLIAFAIVGLDVVFRAIKNIFRGNFLDENFLMSIATIGAFFVKNYPEGVAVMLFYQVGEFFQSYAVGKSKKSIAELMDIRPDYANVKRGESIEKVEPEEVEVGEIIVIRAGERIPLDAVIIEGSTTLDTSALTGESVPREATIGDNILSGCININGLILARVMKEYSESTVSKILDLVENASSKKSNSENFITKFARYYTPVVVVSAVLLAVVPPLVIPNATFGDWIYRALIFLVISCPCALVISVPLSFFCGIGGSSRSGILVKGSNYLEALAKTEIAVFDKTGTLTKGVFKVQKIVPNGVSNNEILEIAAYAEHYSNHPISISLLNAYNKDIDKSRIGEVEEITGHGVISVIDGKKVFVGNTKLMKKYEIPYPQELNAVGTVVHIAVENNYLGHIIIADEVKDDSKQAIAELKKTGIKQTIMLTGDSKLIGESVANELGLDSVFTELLPVDKVEKVEELISKKSSKGKLVFVGDGLNDAPVLARADIGIAMGGLGSDAAIEAADVVIMTDEPSKIATAIKISRRTVYIAKQNIVFALSVKAIVLVLGTVGIATMWGAVFADVGVSVIAIINAMRVLKKAK